MHKQKEKKSGIGVGNWSQIDYTSVKLSATGT